MSIVTEFIAYIGIAGHFMQTKAPGPFFGSANQRGTDSLSPVLQVNPPSLDVSDWR